MESQPKMEFLALCRGLGRSSLTPKVWAIGLSSIFCLILLSCTEQETSDQTSQKTPGPAKATQSARGTPTAAAFTPTKAALETRVGKETAGPTEGLASPTTRSSAGFEPSASQAAKGKGRKKGPGAGGDIVQRIAETKNVFDLYELRKGAEREASLSDEIRVKFEQRQTELASAIQTPPGYQLNDEIDLLAFDFRKMGPGEGDKVKCRTYYLFKVNKRVSGNLRIMLLAFVDDTHKSYLSEGRTDCEDWGFYVDPPSDSWRTGECVLQTYDVLASRIPYNLFLRFYMKTGDQAAVDLGKKIRLGWFAPAD